MGNGLENYRAVIMVPHVVNVAAHGIASAAEHVKTKLNNIRIDYTAKGPRQENCLSGNLVPPSILFVEKIK